VATTRTSTTARRSSSARHSRPTTRTTRSCPKASPTSRSRTWRTPGGWRSTRSRSSRDRGVL